MSRLAHVRNLHHRGIQRFAAAGAVIALVTAVATIDAIAEEIGTDENPESRTVRVSPVDQVDLTARDGDALAGAVGEAIEARQQLVAEPAPEPEPEPEPEPAPEPEPEPAPTAEPQGVVDMATWDRLAECESGGNWSINTGNGFYGGLQFEVSSWEWVGGTGMPHEASKQEQIARAEILLERQGWRAWPACSKKLGLR